MSLRLELHLPARRTAVASARDAFGTLAGSVTADCLQSIQLLVSELVTNSLRHGDLRDGQTIVVVAEAGPALVRVEVRDPGDGFSADAGAAVASSRPQAPAGDVGGWGLFLVEQLATRWGVRHDIGGEHGTAVWFELDVSGDGLSEQEDGGVDAEVSTRSEDGSHRSVGMFGRG